jgi:DNA-binding NtrC family response regulator
MDETRETEGLAPAWQHHVEVRRFRIVVLAGADAGQTYTSNAPKVTLGTHPSNDMVFQDPTLSRFHCEITIEGGQALVRDLGSRNGTLVGGVPVLAAYLRSGVQLRLGRTEVRFAERDEPAQVPVSGEARFGRMVGRSPAMRAVFFQLEQAARSGATILLEGETGTGKDLAAESIHLASGRREGPWVVLDCGAVPAQLVGSELFGHERGAFTGAEQEHTGVLESAAGGTLFLDEIGELPLELQPTLLRALGSGRFTRLGGTRTIAADVRVVASTNRNLRREVNAGRFRADLYYRLAVIALTVPPLRERSEDIGLLVEAMIEELGAAGTAAAATLTSPETLSELERHPWPGNVRELRNHVERAVALRRPLPLDPDEPAEESLDLDLPFHLAKERWSSRFERRYVEALLRRHDNNASQAARAAGLSRSQLYVVMSRCGLR